MRSFHKTSATIFLLMLPPLFWAGNAIVGRLMVGVIPPLTLNFLRWFIALLLLLPFSYRLFLKPAIFMPMWRRYLLLGFLGIGCYNALQYLALVTSSPINVTLVASSIPVFMLVIGLFFFGVKVRPPAALGVSLSISGVIVVVTRGDFASFFTMNPVTGDLLMVLASLCWALYSWLLVRPGERPDPQSLKDHWIHFLFVQIAFGVVCSLVFALLEWAWLDAPLSSHIEWGSSLVMGALYVAIFPGIIAFRAWGLAVERVGPAFAGVVVNTTPLLTALLAMIFLNETPQLYHVLAFTLILGGILVFQWGRFLDLGRS
jgi:drug/metabolite transporter (DMT)-like permease